LLLGLYSASPAWRLPEDEAESLRRDFPDLEIVNARSEEDLLREMPGAEILFSWAPAAGATDRAERLCWVHAPAAGVGAYLTPGFKRRSIPLTNSRGVHAVPISEHVLGVILALARRLRPAIVEQTTTGMKREHWWVGSEIPDELRGKTLGLFGYGAIGREIARRALAFGMRVIALRRRPDAPPRWDPELLSTLGLPAQEPELDLVVGPADLPRFLGESDIVTISAALTPETQGVFDAGALSRMKRGAWLVNVARGKIVREPDLILALEEGRLGAAALDVFDTEPLPRESPLYRLDRVILTPHISGLSRGFWPRAMALFRRNLRRYLEGRPLWNRVDPERGY
jgi:D-2-hydroxyacid dehydrogenase (NADP+)